MIYKFKVGDKVKVIGNLAGHFYPLGSVVEIIELHEQGNSYRVKKDKACWYVFEEDVLSLELPNLY